MSQPRQPLLHLISRSLRRRCPLCGEGKLFRLWLRMHLTCPKCGVTFAREPGYFMGSVYLNYGLTAAIVAGVYPICLFQQLLPQNVLLTVGLIFCVVFPVLVFPFARSFWLGFDEYCDPRPPVPSGDSDADEQSGNTT